MKANVHVDYLSHDWAAHDVIRANIENRKEIRALANKLKRDPANRALRLDHERLVRFQNALWRQMARTCTARLGRDNPLVDPSSVDWQKESDITWLYGPLYTDDEDPPSRATYDPPHGLKPALKKTSTSLYERRGIDDRIPSFSSIASSLSTASSIVQPPTPTASISSTITSNHNGVRFSPESTIKVQYFIPESPVKESLGDNGWNPYWSPMDDEDEDDDGDHLWEFMVDSVQTIQAAVTTWLTPITRQHRQQQPTSTTATAADLMFTLVSVCKSMASLAATWLMYQGMLRVLRRPTSSLRPGQPKRDNTITWQPGRS